MESRQLCDPEPSAHLSLAGKPCPFRPGSLLWAPLERLHQEVGNTGARSSKDDGREEAQVLLSGTARNVLRVAAGGAWAFTGRSSLVLTVVGPEMFWWVPWERCLPGSAPVGTFSAPCVHPRPQG